MSEPGCVVLSRISVSEAKVYIVNETATAQPNYNHSQKVSHQLSNRDTDGQDHEIGQH